MGATPQKMFDFLNVEMVRFDEFGCVTIERKVGENASICQCSSVVTGSLVCGYIRRSGFFNQLSPEHRCGTVAEKLWHSQVRES